MDDVTTKFCVVYQFMVRAGCEAAFEQAWQDLTLAIREQCGGLGSRLHKTDDGWWLAYAQWPDRQTWEQAQTRTTPVHPDAAQRMADAIEGRRPPILLQPQIDLLTPARASAPADEH